MEDKTRILQTPVGKTAAALKANIAAAEAMATATPAIRNAGNLKTIPIGYCGKKAQETDHIYGTGLLWTTDTVHEVQLDKAALLLNHPDVWYDTRPAASRKNDPVRPVVAPNNRTQDGEIFTASIALPQNFEELTPTELDVFSVRNFNVPLDMTEPIEALREKVRSLVEHSKFDELR